MNNVHTLELLSEAGHYIYESKNSAKKDEVAFAKTVEVFKESKTILFNSMITNEEAMILQKLKEIHAFKLVNKDAKKFQDFLNDFASASGKHIYSGSLDSLESCDAVIVLGCSVSTDNEKLASSLKVSNDAGAYINYMHPLEDESLKGVITQHTKYEVGSEEGLVSMLADVLINEEGKLKYKAFFDELDVGYICGESSVGEEEFEDLSEELLKCEKRVLVVGADLYNHPRSKNIAKILGVISKYSNLEILMVPSEGNTLGVSLICDLDEVTEGKSVGYNVQADYTLSFLGDGNLDMPGLSQQEGTITTLDKKVLALNAEDGFDGYRLNDIANALGLEPKKTIDYTAKLPAQSGYKAVAFDDLVNSGYTLEDIDAKNEDDAVEDVDDISEFNGTVVYRCNHSLNQFNPDNSKSDQNEGDLVLLGSKQFATAAKIKTETMVRFEMDGKTYQRKFKVCEDLKGTIAYNSVFDSTDNYDEYRYKRVNLEEVNE